MWPIPRTAAQDVSSEPRQRTEGETHRRILVGVDGAGQVNEDNEQTPIADADGIGSLCYQGEWTLMHAAWRR